jgi:tetratricopeptide (TPR) repeat protein
MDHEVNKTRLEMVLHPYEQPRVLTCQTCGVPIASDALIEAGTRCIVDARPVAEMIDLRCPHCHEPIKDGLPRAWAEIMMVLAACCGGRVMGNRTRNLENALALYRAAFAVWDRQNTPFEWALAQLNLARIYLAYADVEPGLAVQSRQHALDALDASLQVTARQTDPLQYAMTMSVAGTLYLDRAEGDEAENLARAIRVYTEALEVEESVGLPGAAAITAFNLAVATARHADLTAGERPAHMKRLMDACDQALSIWTRANEPFNWADALATRARARDLYRQRTLGKVVTRLIVSPEVIADYRQALGVYHPSTTPDRCRRTAQALGDVLFDQGRWSDAADAYDLAIQAAEQTYRTVLLRSSQQIALAGVGDLYHRAAYARARTGAAREALVRLDGNRARGLHLALQRSRAPLAEARASDPEAVAAFEEAARRLSELERDQQVAAQRRTACDMPALEDLRGRADALNAELDRAVARIRELPGCQHFLAPVTAADIAQAARLAGALVYLVTTPAGGVALIAGGTSGAPAAGDEVAVESVWLPGFRAERFRELLDAWYGAYDRRHEAFQDWLDVIAEVTGILWDDVMGPVTAAVSPAGGRSEGPGQLVLLPTGLLSLLPWHAAWTEDRDAATGRRYLLDDFVVTYAAGARAVNAAVAAATAAAGRRADGCLVIENPDGTLDYAPQEAGAVSSYFPGTATRRLRGSEANVRAVLDALPDYPVLHFATHGRSGWLDPLQSELLLAGEQRLALPDLLALRLEKGRLAVLSACESGVPSTDLPDEMAGLPTGFQQAGLAGVVASLWAVNDPSTAMLMERFYRLWRQDGLAPAEALRAAQIWLRDTTNRGKADYFKRDVPALAGCRMPEMVAADFFSQATARRPADRDFAHPFWWAAFYLTGV